jgi:carbon-monoxide dehydrogenase small subunit
VITLQRPTKFILNGATYEDTIPGNLTLLDYVRRNIGLTGSKESCGTGDCGSCSMIVNGEVIKSCLMLAVEADGKDVTTVEGLAKDGQLHPIQEAFVTNWGTQCGYCTPGFVVTAKALLDHNPNPTDDDIKHATAGNLCRCTGYVKIIESIKDAARMLQEKRGS